MADPWAIWVSEVMLQQTRVEVVRHVFPRFLQRFPTPAALAVATDDALLSAWRGLGYYRRARLLREGARAVVAQHGGVVPSSRAELRALPGIGPYTSGAIASIAFGLAEVAVDGNVERVAARHRGIAGQVHAGAAAALVRETAEAWLDPRRPGDFNQALMELGAVMCTPRQPRCGECPVARDCVALALERQDELPESADRRAYTDVLARAALVPLGRGRVLGSRIPDDEVNAGQIDLPGPGALVPVATPAALEQVLEWRYGVGFSVGEVVTTVRHTITHHRIRLLVHRADCAHGPGPNLMAARPDDPALPWSTLARKAFRQAALFLTAPG